MMLRNHRVNVLLFTISCASMSNRPKVGVAVFISNPKHPGCIILGKRKGSLGDGKYAPPGGHLEFSESFEECAKRETLEETGLVLKNVMHHNTVNAIWPEENYHYVIIVMKGEVDENYDTEPVNKEPHKCHGWNWFHWDFLPDADERFEPLNIIRATGYTPFS